MGLQVHSKFQRNRPNRYRVTASGTFMGKGCARAHVQMHSTNDLWKALTMDFKPSVSVLFGHYSLPGPRILTKLGRTKFEKTT